MAIFCCHSDLAGKREALSLRLDSLKSLFWLHSISVRSQSTSSISYCRETTLRLCHKTVSPINEIQIHFLNSDYKEFLYCCLLGNFMTSVVKCADHLLRCFHFCKHVFACTCSLRWLKIKVILDLWVNSSHHIASVGSLSGSPLMGQSPRGVYYVLHSLNWWEAKL